MAQLIRVAMRYSLWTPLEVVILHRQIHISASIRPTEKYDLPNYIRILQDIRFKFRDLVKYKVIKRGKSIFMVVTFLCSIMQQDKLESRDRLNSFVTIINVEP